MTLMSPIGFFIKNFFFIPSIIFRSKLKSQFC